MTMDMVDNIFFTFGHMCHANELPHSFKQLYNTVYGGLGDQQVGVVAVVGGEVLGHAEVVAFCPWQQFFLVFWS